jgi:fumarate reductase flavoprotein subunit
LLRTESRGAHYREDYPQRNDHDWLKRTLAAWENASDDLPTIRYEDIAVSDMELPPGFRGYGTRNHIDHPETEARVAEVERITAGLAGADRFERQAALMEYESLLPEKYRGRNERLTERLP